MNEREDTAHRPYTKLIGAEILAKDYSNDPPDRRLYGRWRCYDGREVLFNRSYQPLWERRAGQPVEMANPSEWVNGIDTARPSSGRTAMGRLSEATAFFGNGGLNDQLPLAWRAGLSIPPRCMPRAEAELSKARRVLPDYRKASP
jgi:hypothetical protein